MKVCNRTRDPLTNANWSLTERAMTRDRPTVGPGIPNSVIPQIMAISANEVMAIESVRGACQQMGVKEFFQLAICVGVKNDSYLF